MALKWLVHSGLFTSAFGYPKNDINGYLNDGYGSTKTMGYPKGRLTDASGKSLQTTAYPKGELTDASGKSLMKGETYEGKTCKDMCPTAFQMPLHYPRYKKVDYEKMEEWKVDMLLKEYGLSYEGNLDEKRSFAMGAFLWPDQI